MRLAYLGTPTAAVAPLRALVAAGHDVELVVTRADKRRGRGSALVPSPVKAAALELALEVTTDVDAVMGRGLELGVVVAFGRIIKPHVLAEVPMVNLHFSLLPRWRGAAPVERAVLAGDAETGVCLMEVVEGLDEGGIYAVERVAVGGEETAAQLRSRLVDVGTDMLVARLAGGPGSLGRPTPQVGEVTYATKVEPDELRLRFDEPAALVQRRVRLGRAWTTFAGRRLLVLQAGVAAPIDATAPADPGTVDADLGVTCGDGRRLVLVKVQPEGRAAMEGRAWSNGARPVGARLGP